MQNQDEKIIDEKYVRKMESDLEAIKKKLILYEEDATYKSFFAMNKILNQQIEELNLFKLSTEIRQNPKEDKFYDRMKDIWEDLPKMVEGLNKLKDELKIHEIEGGKPQKLSFIDTLADRRD